MGGEQEQIPQRELQAEPVKADAQLHPAPLQGLDNSQLGTAGFADPNKVTDLEGGMGGHAEAEGGSAFWINERQQGHDAGSLDRIGEVSLLFGGEARQPAGQDLAALGYELLEQIDILVVDRVAGLDRRKTLFEKGTGHLEKR